MQIIFSEKECELIFLSLIDSQTKILQNISHGKDKDKEEKDRDELESLNGLIDRMRPYANIDEK